MATLRFPDAAGESACTYNGSTTLTLSGTALTGGRTFANAAADTDIDFDDGDLVAVKAIDADGDFEIWKATWASAGATLTKVSRISVHNTLATTGVTIYAVPSGDWFTEIEKVRLEHDTAAPVGSNVTAAVGKWYNMDLSGMTAARLFVLPDSVAVGSLIGFRVDVKAPTTTAYVLKVATAASGSLLEGVDESAGSAKYAVFIAGESMQFRCIKNGGAGDTDWVVDVDGGGRIPCKATMGRNTTGETYTTATMEKVNLNNEVLDIGGIADPTTNNRFDIRRDGKYLIGAISGTDGHSSGTRVISAVQKNAAEISRSASVYTMGATKVTASPPPLVFDVSAGDYLELYVFHDTGSDADTASGVNASQMSVLEVF